MPFIPFRAYVVFKRKLAFNSKITTYVRLFAFLLKFQTYDESFIR